MEWQGFFFASCSQAVRELFWLEERRGLANAASGGNSPRG